MTRVAYVVGLLASGFTLAYWAYLNGASDGARENYGKGPA